MTINQAVKPNHSLFVLEGLDYSGKSTLSHELQSRLDPNEFSFFSEPYGLIGDFIREHSKTFDKTAKMLLFASARRDFVQNILKPALTQRHVILDRFTASTLAYQVAGDGNDRDTVTSILELSTEGLQPVDSTFYLDISMPLFKKRRQNRNKLDSLDTYDEIYYQRVKQAYFKACCDTSDELHVIPSEWDTITQADIVQECIQRNVKTKL